MTTTPTVEQLVQDALLTTGYNAGYCQWHDDEGMPFLIPPSSLCAQLDWYYDEADPDWLAKVTFPASEA